MGQNDQVYIKLQKHLDNQAVGFPATKTGVEIRILKHIFTPEEAEIASFLSYKFEPLEIIYGRVEPLVQSPEELEMILDGIQKKGGIEFKIKNGEKHYCNAPLVVGMYEFQLDRLTPEFIKDFNDYTSDRNFGVEFLSTELPQMRTIPVARSIHPQYNVSTFDEVTTLLQEAEEPFVIIECICRKKKSIEGESCKVTDRKETCLAIGGMAQMTLANDVGRKITRDEAMSIIEQNQKEGLVLQPSNTKIAEFICSCCGCCCGMLAMHKNLPKPLDFWATNFHAVVDKNTCEGCGICEESCQVGAVSVSEKEQYAVVNLDRCLGCGVCVSNCPTESISLLKKPTEVIPPQTREELIDIIMDRKKGRFGKLMLTGKLFFDAVRTGQTHLLK
ncbi:MAG: 4Fe-4S binding protein [Deltaproteobacteria bacterium]|nr:4Fe-4S binding protein [Deltaproteobacteria bacterium]MBW2119399.1 4Fe-4S binding protein [Deltaproteobacteria bacterium]MBW2345147.1 4Fe-4S binding protein [Deltaproteobacteria bacterium]